MRSGRVQARVKPPERAWAKVLREAGGSVHEQHFLRNTTLDIDPADNRRIDILATGLPLLLKVTTTESLNPRVEKDCEPNVKLLCEDNPRIV